MEKITCCPNCGSSNINHLYTVPDRHYGNEGEFELDKCNICKLVFLNPMYNDSELGKFYPENSYYSYYMDYEPKKIRWTQKLYTILSLDFLTKPGIEDGKGKKILDIGCGNGWTIFQYKKKGWNVNGVEPGKTASEIGNKKGLNIFNGSLLEAGFPDNEFDFIRSNHSFEHIYNPNETLTEIYRILKPDGKLLIGIPNFAGFNSKIFKKYWFHLSAPVHTFSYSPGNISQILKKHHFKVTKIRYVSTYHGSLGSLQVLLNEGKDKRSYEGKLINSTYLKLLFEWYSKFQNLIRIGDCIEVIAIKQ